VMTPPGESLEVIRAGRNGANLSLMFGERISPLGYSERSA
jgi:hypothetical protein